MGSPLGDGGIAGGAAEAGCAGSQVADQAPQLPDGGAVHGAGQVQVCKQR